MSQQMDENEQIDFYNSRPAKRVGGGVLIFNKEGALLLIKPSYRNTWSWPGGGSDSGESPYATAVRECKEEIGILPESLQLAFVNYVPPRPDGTLDVIHFVFIMDPVDSNFITKLKLPKNEIDAAEFIPITELEHYMKDYRVRAVKTYLQHKSPNAMLYLEDGRLV